MTQAIASVQSIETPAPIRVAVGMSGGVDSSTVAAMLQDQGYAMEGVTLWLMKGKGQCCSEGMVDAMKQCEEMGVPHHVVDSRESFERNIINYLVEGYQAGITPLPCSNCNTAVKFGPMLDYAMAELGINYIATGHYARVRFDQASGRHQLLRAIDRNKDQTYFLYDLDQRVLGHVLFPLGETCKTETRKIATDFGLATADKPESQDLCLVEANGSMRAFLEKYITPVAGDIVDQSGRIMGKHDGIHNYTIGQRKGLGIAHSEPLYVVALDAVMNRVIVGAREALLSSAFTVSRVNWVSVGVIESPIHAEVQIRYRSTAVGAMVEPIEGDRVRITFDEPQPSVTPGQAAVWYDGEVLLGGGIIDRLPTP
jgi:tRNA-uridine 2-sulfurtransferase